MGRARLDTPAIVHLGSSEVVCGTRDLSVKGIALTGATKAPAGSFLRLVLRLPGSPRPIDLDGVLVRSTVEEGSTTWGLEFYEPPRHVTEALARYVADNRCDGPFARQVARQREVRLRAEAPDQEPAPADAEPQSAAGPEPEEQPEQSLDQELMGLYESALEEPHEKEHRGFWHRLSHHSGS